MIEYGFIDAYGITWDKTQVDLYNKLSERIDNREKAGYDVSEAKIDRHRIYHMPLFLRSKK